MIYNYIYIYISRTYTIAVTTRNKVCLGIARTLYQECKMIIHTHVEGPLKSM